MTTTKDISANTVSMAAPLKSIEKPCGKMQVTWGTKNQAPRSWQQEVAWQNQA